MRRALGMQQKVGSLTAVLSENLSAFREIRAFNLEKREEKRFKQSSEDFLYARMKVVKYSQILTPLIEILTAVGISFAIFQAARSSIRLDAVVPVITALYIAYEPIKKLGNINNKIKEALASLQRLNEILLADETIAEKKNAFELSGIKHGIEFNSVSFTYEGSNVGSNVEPALKNLNLKVKAGESIALVGPSGAGKSTILNLIPRFYDVNAGRITIDGTDIRDVTFASLRGGIALVSQEITMFDDTVRANIAYGRPNASDDEIFAAAKHAAAHDFIMDMPDGYDTYVGERGTKVSGGQRQRLAIARAMLKDAPILLLDEATSALDTESERHIQAALKELMKGRTTLVIAHRLSTVMDADLIHVIDKGKLSESGTHAELLAKNGIYARLYQLQFSDQQMAEQARLRAAGE